MPTAKHSSARLRPTGPACHTGAEICFGVGTGDTLSALDATIAVRAHDGPDPGAGYTRRLTDRYLRLKKLGEEASELVTACADGDTVRATEETADLLYYALVVLHAGGALERHECEAVDL